MCIPRKVLTKSTGARLVPVSWLDSRPTVPQAVRVLVLTASRARARMQRVRRVLRADAPELDQDGVPGNFPRYLRYQPQMGVGNLGRAGYSVPTHAAWRAYQRSRPVNGRSDSRQWCFSQAAPNLGADFQTGPGPTQVVSVTRSAARVAAPRCGRASNSPKKCHLTVMFKYPLSSNLL